MTTKQVIDAAKAEIGEAHILVKQQFPNDTDEDIQIGLKRCFGSINQSSLAILNAQALLHAYPSFRK